MSPTKSYKILFVPLDSTGHVNACVGIAEQLAAMGHEVHFAIEAAWRGTLAPRYGFHESIYTDPMRPPGLGPNEWWLRSMDMIKDTLHESALYKAGHQSLQGITYSVYNISTFYYYKCNIHHIFAKLNNLIRVNTTTIQCNRMRGIPQ